MANTNFSNAAGSGTVGADGFVSTGLSPTSIGSLTLTAPLNEAVGTIAAAGSTQGAATAIPSTTGPVINVTATASSEGVKLPTAATGLELTLLAPNTKGVKVYGGAAGQVINANTTATTAYAMTSAATVTFRAINATTWRVSPTGGGSSGSFSTLNTSGLATLNSASVTTTLGVTGLATLSGGLTNNGALKLNGQTKVTPVTVKATGNSVATARTVGTTSSFIVTTASASTEGVKLPTPSTGLQVQIQAPTAVAVLVYASAAGQSIGTGTTNTTSFKVTANTGTLFTAISTTKWLVSVA